MLNNFVLEMCNFITHGFFLAFMLITLPHVSHNQNGNLSRNMINQAPSRNLKYVEVMVPCSKHGITMALFSVK